MFQTRFPLILCGVLAMVWYCWGQPLPTCSELAKTRSLQPGLPAYSDVMVRSLYIRPENEKDPHNTLRMLTDFHITRLEWMYCSDTAFITTVRNKGIRFGNAIGSIQLNDAASQNYIRDLNGNPVIAPWMRVWKTPTIYTCTSHPKTVEIFLNKLTERIGWGLDTIQIDDPDMNVVAVNWGGCFCDYCMTQFNDHLAETAAAKELTKMGIDSLQTFNLKQHLLANGAPVGDMTWRWDGWNALLRSRFYAFQKLSVQRCMENVRSRLLETVGKHIPMSCNNGNGIWPSHLTAYDYGMGEFTIREAEPGFIYHRLKHISALGKGQVYTMPVGKAILLPEHEPVIRRHLAMVYACGGQILLPWDTYLDSTPEGSIRYFGKPEQYADLSGFIRGMAAYLDGFELVTAAGFGIEGNDLGDAAPIVIDSRSMVTTVVRAKPGQADATVVVHLVNWSDSYANVMCVLNPERFFGDRPIRVTLFTPTPYCRDMHQNAAQTGNYSPLVQQRVLADGRINQFHVGPLETWGILTVEPSETFESSDALWSPIIEPMGARFAGNITVKIAANQDTKIRFTLDGSEPHADAPVYKEPIVLTDSAVVKAAVFSGGRHSPIVRCGFEKKIPLPPVRPDGMIKPGIALKIYHGAFSAMPDFASLKPDLETTAEDIIGCTFKTDQIQMAYEAESYVDIRQAGLYEFFGFSNNRKHETRIYLNDRLVAHIRNNFQLIDSQVALDKGLYRLQIEHYQAAADGNALLVHVKGPGQIMGQLASDRFNIPATKH